MRFPNYGKLKTALFLSCPPPEMKKRSDYRILTPPGFSSIPAPCLDKNCKLCYHWFVKG